MSASAVRKFFSGITGKLGLKKVFKSSGTTLRNVLIFVLVFGLERIFEKDVFKCPDNRHRIYGILFLFCPAVSLFVLTLLLNVRFWEVLTGCRLSQFRPSFVLKRVTSMIFQAFLPSGVWIVVALIQTNYYVCLQLGPKDTAIKKATRNTTNPKEIKRIHYEIDRKFTQAQCESHEIAWAVFVTLIVVAFVVVCIRRCWFLQADGDLPDLEEYQKLEASAAVESFKEHIQELAAEEGRAYVTDTIESAQIKELRNGYLRVEFTRNELAKKYPRTTGDLSKPYMTRREKTKAELNGNYVINDSQV